MTIKLQLTEIVFDVVNVISALGLVVLKSSWQMHHLAADIMATSYCKRNLQNWAVISKDRTLCLTKRSQTGSANQYFQSVIFSFTKNQFFYTAPPIIHPSLSQNASSHPSSSLFLLRCLFHLPRELCTISSL